MPMFAILQTLSEQFSHSPPLAVASLFGADEASVVGDIGERLGLSSEDMELLSPPAGVLQMPPVRLRY